VESQKYLFSFIVIFLLWFNGCAVAAVEIEKSLLKQKYQRSSAPSAG